MTYYVKTVKQKLVPYEEGMDITLVSISEADKLKGSPKKGDMIASNPEDPNDYWLVEEEWFKKYYEPVEVNSGLDEAIILDTVKSAINLAEDLCEDQSNTLTSGQVCTAVLREVRKHLSTSKHRIDYLSDELRVDKKVFEEELDKFGLKTGYINILENGKVFLEGVDLYPELLYVVAKAAVKATQD